MAKLPAPARLVSVMTASSNSGAACVRRLLASSDARVAVRAVFRSQDKADALAAGFPNELNSGKLQIVVGPDAGKPDTLRLAFEGAEVATIVTPAGGALGKTDDAALSNAMIHAAVAAGVKHICYVGSWTAALETPTIIGSRFRPTEKLLRDLGASGKLTFTSLRSGFFHGNYGMQWKHSIKGTNSIAWPKGFQIPSVDPDDMGVVAAHIALSDDLRAFHGKFMHVSGPERLNGQQLADAINRVTGRQITWAPTPKDEYLKKVPQYLRELFLEYDSNHDVMPLSDTVEIVTGSKPTSFEQWLTANKKAFD